MVEQVQMLLELPFSGNCYVTLTKKGVIWESIVEHVMKFYQWNEMLD